MRVFQGGTYGPGRGRAPACYFSALCCFISIAHGLRRDTYHIPGSGFDTRFVTLELAYISSFAVTDSQIRVLHDLCETRRPMRTCGFFVLTASVCVADTRTRGGVDAPLGLRGGGDRANFTQGVARAGSCSGSSVVGLSYQLASLPVAGSGMCEDGHRRGGSYARAGAASHGLQSGGIGGAHTIPRGKRVLRAALSDGGLPADCAGGPQPAETAGATGGIGTLASVDERHVQSLPCARTGLTRASLSTRTVWWGREGGRVHQGPVVAAPHSRPGRGGRGGTRDACHGAAGWCFGARSLAPPHHYAYQGLLRCASAAGGGRGATMACHDTELCRTGGGHGVRRDAPVQARQGTHDAAWRCLARYASPSHAYWVRPRRASAARFRREVYAANRVAGTSHAEGLFAAARGGTPASAERWAAAAACHGGAHRVHPAFGPTSGPVPRFAGDSPMPTAGTPPAPQGEVALWHSDCGKHRGGSGPG